MIIGIDASRANVVERTGTERYAWEIIKRLIPMMNNHRVRLYVREPLIGDWPTLPSHVEVKVLTWPLGILWSHLRLSWELFWHRPGLLFVPADTVPLIHPARTFSTIHDVAFERFPDLYRKNSVYRKIGFFQPIINLLVRLVTLGKYSASELDYHRWSVRQAVRTCRSILTVSEFSKTEIINTLHVLPERITVTHLGCDQPEHYSEISDTQKQNILSTLSITKPFFLFIGRLENKKNIHVIIQAYQEYYLNTPQPIDLVLVGKPGHGWDEVEPIVRSGEISSHIHVLGWQSDPVVDVLRISATAFIFLSQYEGFGLPVLESMSAGVPVICSRQGALVEIGGQTAIFVDPDNVQSVITSMQEIVDNQKLRNSIILSGQEWVKQFTWDNTAKKTFQLLLP